MADRGVVYEGGDDGDCELGGRVCGRRQSAAPITGQEVSVDLDWLKWDAKGLVSVIFQDYETKDVLTLAYMNKEALQCTVETGKVHVFRRSRGKVMAKGEQSGRHQVVKEIRLDCDGDALVMLIEQIGGAACHEGYRSCFFRKVTGEVLETIGERVFDPKEVYGR